MTVHRAAPGTRNRYHHTLGAARVGDETLDQAALRVVAEAEKAARLAERVADLEQSLRVTARALDTERKVVIESHVAHERLMLAGRDILAERDEVRETYRRTVMERDAARNAATFWRRATGVLVALLVALLVASAVLVAMAA